MQCIDDSLRRLGTDYVDLYQIHRWDYRTPIEETLEALHDIVKAGKARYIVHRACLLAVRPIALQSRSAWLDAFRLDAKSLHLVYREEEREMNPFCREEASG